VAAGVAAVVVEEGGDLPPVDVPLVLVPSAREALARLAATFYGHPARRLRVIGVTGTDGKTTTCHLIGAVLEEAGYRTGSISTVYIKIGDRVVPNPFHQTTPEAPEIQQALAEMVARGVEYAIIETTSHGLALHRVDECHYDVAVFTNLTSDHLDFHVDREDYLAQKARLFVSLGQAVDKGLPKVSILNADDPAGSYLAELSPCRVLTYGIDREAEVRAETVSPAGWGTSLLVHTPAGEVSLRLPLIGIHNVYNALAALALGLSQGLDLSIIKAALEGCAGVPGRMERVEGGQDFLVVVDFAHTAHALQRALETLRPLARGRLIVAFGCPGERDRSKRPRMGQVAARLADFIVLTSDEPRSEDPLAIIEEIEAGVRAAGRQEGRDYLKAPDRREALALALGQARTGDVVLLAGKGHEDCIIIGEQRIPWSDRQVALELLASRRPA
jgi:UDP-N-acetylmuramoyl-L-alanyl-D-glutamate--2,6-diaminopimelate ligase